LKKNKLIISSDAIPHLHCTASSRHHAFPQASGNSHPAPGIINFRFAAGKRQGEDWLELFEKQLGIKKL
jgi:hypothetical protein